MVDLEKDAEAARLVEAIAGESVPDMEAWEMAVRAVSLLAGARALERLLRGIGSGRRDRPLVCACGARMRSIGQRSKTLKTVLGRVRYRRSLFTCPSCGQSRVPGDELLGVQNTGFSPGARRLMARAGSRAPFGAAAEDLEVYAEIRVDAKDVERVAEQVGREADAWMAAERQKALDRRREPAGREDIPILYVSFDGTGVPMRASELAGRAGKQPDGTAKTREVKLGCVFTQTTRDEDGRPVRDPASTSYVGAIETSDEFGWRIYGEAVRRGVRRARRTVLLTDGAEYNKSIARMHFDGAVHIIDLYHAREHLSEFCKLTFRDEKTRRAVEADWRNLLDRGRIEKLTRRMETHLPRSGPRRKAGLRQIAYFRRNAPHMRYDRFRAEGLFVGSGVMEAGCRTLVGQRLKQSGMFWSEPGANAIIASRCCQFSNRFEDFWTAQLN